MLPPEVRKTMHREGVDAQFLAAEIKTLRRQRRRDRVEKVIYKTKEKAAVPQEKTMEIVTFSLLKTMEKVGPPLSKSIDFLAEKSYKSTLNDIDRMHQLKKDAGKIFPHEQWYFEEYKDELERDGLSNPKEKKTWRTLKEKHNTGTLEMLEEYMQAHTAISRKDLKQLENLATTPEDQAYWSNSNKEFQSLISDWLIQFPPLLTAGGIKNGSWSAMGNVPDQQMLAAGGSVALGFYLNAFIKANNLPNHLGRLKGDIAPKLDEWMQEQKKALADFNKGSNIYRLTTDIFDGGVNRVIKTMDEGYAIATGAGIALAQGLTLSDEPKKLIFNLGVTAATVVGMKKIFTWNLSRVGDYRAKQDELNDLQTKLDREDRHNPQLNKEAKAVLLSAVSKLARANVLKETAINAAPWVATMSGGDPFPASVVASAMAPFGDLTRDTWIKKGDDARMLLREMINHVSTSDYRVPSYTEIEAAREKMVNEQPYLARNKQITTKAEAFKAMKGGHLRVGHLATRSSTKTVEARNGLILHRGYNLVLAPSGIEGGKSDFIDLITLKLGDVSYSHIAINNTNSLWLDPKLRKELIHVVNTSSSPSKKTFAEELVNFVNDLEPNDFRDSLMKIRQDCRRDKNSPLVKQYGLAKIEEIFDILLSKDELRKDALVSGDGWLTYLKKWTNPDPKKRASYQDANDLSDEAVASVLLTEAFKEETGELFNFKSVDDAIRYLATKPGDGTSSGEKKAWDIWKGLAKERLVVILDEPTSNLSRVGVRNQPSLYSRVANHIEKRLRKNPDTIFIVIDHYADYIEFMQGQGGHGINSLLSVEHREADGKKHTIWSQDEVNYIDFDRVVKEYYGEDN